MAPGFRPHAAAGAGRAAPAAGANPIRQPKNGHWRIHVHRKAFIVLSLLALAWAAPIPSRALDPLKDDGAARIARMPHTSIQKAEEDKPIIVRRRKLIQFTEPPIGEPRESARLPPPLVTFRSDPALRAKYPPNPNAPTVSQSLRQEFGQLVQFDYSLSGTDEDGLIRAAST